MDKFAEGLATDRFLVTCELNPPKGMDLGPLFKEAATLSKLVDAFNITDSAASRMAMSPIAVAHLLLDREADPILQVTGRDKNKIALQADLLAAAALGISNVLCLTGDSPASGDHPNAKAVFDLDAVGILGAAKSLQLGKDMGGNKLKGSPVFTLGAVANPVSQNLEKEIERMEQKIQEGASFFQTQAVYDVSSFEKFINVAQKFKVPILAGFIILKSAKMARNLNANLPGIYIPPNLVQELEETDSPRNTSIEISGRVIGSIKAMCRGVHIMPIGWETSVPNILQQAGI